MRTARYFRKLWKLGVRTTVGTILAPRFEVKLRPSLRFRGFAQTGGREERHGPPTPHRDRRPGPLGQGSEDARLEPRRAEEWRERQGTQPAGGVDL